MTGFSVQPTAVRQLAQQVDRAREDVLATRRHLTKMQDFEGGEGVIGQLTAGRRDAYRALDEWLGALAEPTLSSVSKAIADSAAYYERTDQVSAAELDATYPAADATGQRKHTGYISAEGSPIEFLDVQEPRGRLNTIKNYHDERHLRLVRRGQPDNSDRRRARSREPRGGLARSTRTAGRPLGRDRQTVGR